MNLVEIRENAVTVELDWSDVKYLTHIIRHAISHDVGSTTHEPTLVVTYAETAEALLLAGGMASWAQTVGEEEYTVERFAEVVPLTPEEEARWQQRVRESQRDRAAEEARKVERPPAA